MQVEFSEDIPLSPTEIYRFFRTPADWSRLYGAFGEARDRGDGWYSVPLRRSPFSLVTRMTETIPDRHAAWDFAGFWTGHGEIHLTPSRIGTLITGYETVAMPRVLGLWPVVETWLLQTRFQALWDSGWRRLRQMAESRR